MRKALLLSLASLLILATVVGTSCAGTPSEASTARSSEPRITNPQVPEGDLRELASGNAEFAFALYQAIRGAQGNLFYSPHSISAALAMTYAGAKSATADQMRSALRYQLPQDQLHAAFNALDQQLTSRGQGAQGQDEKGFRLKIANSVWGQTGYSFLPAYLDILAKYYGAGLRLTDFRTKAEPSRIAINDWVKEQTEGKIVDLIPAGAISEITRLVLANAVYFNAAWKYPFEKESTRPGDFSLLDGSKVSMPMMTNLKTYRYAKGDGYQAVELAYDGDQIAMDILVPDKGSFEQIEKLVTGDWIAGVLGRLEAKQVQLTLPKFTYSSSLGLAKTLSQMGMKDAFDPGQADFSGIAGNRELFITDVIHKAVVAVNEKGTEAAAATAVIVGATAMPKIDVTLRIDRPFVFLIRDLQTGSVIFVGRVLNPATE